jgi:hypothetical protein
MYRIPLPVRAALAGVLGLTLILVLLFVGCERTECGGVCPPTGPLIEADDTSGNQVVDESLLSFGDWICRWLPPLCRRIDPCRDPWEIPPFWGHDHAVNPPSPDDAAKWIAMHNGLLDAWDQSPLRPEALILAYEAQAAKYRVDASEMLRRDDLRRALDAVFDGRLSIADLPSIERVRCIVAGSPPSRPFAGSAELDRLLARLEDGVDAGDAAAFAAFRDAQPEEDLDARFAAGMMAASVEWWAGYEERTGRIASHGVAADLDAMAQGADQQRIIIASAIGLVLDLVKFFYSD